jgi:Protein of unknown function (DUF2948)
MAATNQPLKLLARDAEDLRIIAGFLQDAIVPVAEMCFLGDEKRFAMVVNRFRWEVAPEDAAPAAAVQEGGDASFEEDAPMAAYERIHCGVCFDGIMSARMRGFDRRDRSLMLSLLTLEAEEGAVLMHFSGGACIRLEGEEWQCRMKDIGEPWPTLHRPRHPEDEAAA